MNFGSLEVGRSLTKRHSTVLAKVISTVIGNTQATKTSTHPCPITKKLLKITLAYQVLLEAKLQLHTTIYFRFREM
jgi:hypothetical protein